MDLIPIGPVDDTLTLSAGDVFNRARYNSVRPSDPATINIPIDRILTLPSGYNRQLTEKHWTVEQIQFIVNVLVCCFAITLPVLSPFSIILWIGKTTGDCRRDAFWLWKSMYIESHILIITTRTSKGFQSSCICRSSNGQNEYKWDIITFHLWPIRWPQNRTALPQ